MNTFFRICSGIRQGGILSPSLFAVYVDDLLLKLSESKRGCFLKLLCLNSIMYADDLILLSICIADLQYLVDFCVEEFKAIGLALNINKTACMRVGARYAFSALPIAVGTQRLAWVNELSYLGIKLLSGKKIQC